MLPILVGLGIGAALGGGIAALQKKDILQGALMGGIGGALGGAFAPAAGLGGATASGMGATGLSQGATAGAVNAFESQLPGMASSITGTGGVAGVGAMAPMGAAGSGLTSLGGAVPTAASNSLFSGGFGNFLGANKYALAGGALGGMMAPGEKPPEPEQGNIRDYTYSQTRNPEFGVTPGAAYFNQGYTAGAVTPVEDYTAADGGIIALAEGGQALELAPYQPVETQRYAAPVRAIHPAVTDYNAQLLQRANQQYNINPRPLPNQVPGSPGYGASTTTPTASTASDNTGDFIDQYYQQMLGRKADPTGRALIENAMGQSWYDPARDIPDVIRKSEEFQRSGLNANPTGIQIGQAPMAGKAGGQPSGYAYDPVTRRYSGGIGPLAGKEKSELEKMREEMDAMRSSQGGGSMAGDGAANGGLMSSYAGGGLSSLGSYSDGGRLLKGPGDGVSDDIPAQIGDRQPARLADGEFVVPARVVSEIGNGSTDAGAKRLYAMMDRVQNARKKSVGKGKVAVDSKAHKMLPA